MRSLVGRRGWVVWALASGVVFASACSGGGDDDDTPKGVGTGNTGNTANRTGKGGSGGGSGEGGLGFGLAPSAGGAEDFDPLAPVIRVTSPAAETDPNGAGVIVDAELDAVCLASQSPEAGSRPVSASSVYMQMLDARGKVVPNVADGTAVAIETGNKDEYTAHFQLNQIPENGAVSFRCVAGDTSEPARVGSGEITTFVDHGPTITRSEPKESSAHALLGALHVEFSVDPAPVVDDGSDNGAAVASVELLVGGMKIEDLEEKGGVYTADVSLSDTSLFPSAPSGETPITIRATNSREPTAVTAIDSYTFVVDGEGPKIAVTAPANGSVAGGLVTLTFDVTDDASGVDPDTVIVILNGDRHHYGEGGDWAVEGDHFTYTFDSRLIENTVAQAVINLRAKDKAGNDAEGESWLIYLDNVAPVVDLNPPNMRAWKKDSNAQVCSVSFDPLGIALGDDQNNVVNLETDDNADKVRALVWEETNDGADHVFSGTVEEEVRIYIQPNPDEPFLAESGDGDDECDDIDEKARDALEFIRLLPVTPAGEGSYGPGDEDVAPPLSGGGFSCSLPTMAGSAPQHLCMDEASDLTMVVPHDSPGRPPVVFALGPLDGVLCTGRRFELGAHAQEGWVCLAGRAQDYAGNIGISQPLRVCYDDARTPEHPACLDGKNPPSCTDGCTPPAHFPREDGELYARQ